MSNPDSLKCLYPGTTLGMLGGGQLGRMFCQAAQQMGYRVVVMDPDPNSPAGVLADVHIQASYTDTDGLNQLMNQCQAVSTEFENIPAESLALLAQNITVRPHAGAVSVTQDRLLEKSFFKQAGVEVVPYAEIRSPDNIHSAPEALFPGILKAARLGYDGKGQVRVKTRAEALSAFTSLGEVDCILEALMPLDYEISIVLARDAQGNTRCYPPIQNEHREGILAVSESDAPRATEALALQAQQAAITVADKLGYIGVLCVEFFVLKEGRLLANEMAPRPHNSGHYTIDASDTSQFEQQVRVLTGMPLGESGNHRFAIMLNLLGDIWFLNNNNTPSEPAWDKVLSVSGAHLHLYGKTRVSRGRKMGHVTIVGSTRNEVHTRAAQVAGYLGIDF